MSERHLAAKCRALQANQEAAAQLSLNQPEHQSRHTESSCSQNCQQDCCACSRHMRQACRYCLRHVYHAQQHQHRMEWRKVPHPHLRTHPQIFAADLDPGNRSCVVLTCKKMIKVLACYSNSSHAGMCVDISMSWRVECICNTSGNVWAGQHVLNDSIHLSAPLACKQRFPDAPLTGSCGACSCCAMLLAPRLTIG